jgi:hypothetical protein
MDRTVPMYFRDEGVDYGYYKLYEDMGDGDFKYIRVNNVDDTISLDYDNVSTFSRSIKISEEEFNESICDTVSHMMRLLENN